MFYGSTIHKNKNKMSFEQYDFNTKNLQQILSCKRLFMISECYYVGKSIIFPQISDNL